MNNTRVGLLIRELRLEKHLTQRQLAEQMNITEQSRISRTQNTAYRLNR